MKKSTFLKYICGTYDMLIVDTTTVCTATEFSSKSKFNQWAWKTNTFA